MRAKKHKENATIIKMTIGDKMLIVLTIILSISSVFYIKATAISSLEKDVVVRYDGVEVAKLSLNIDKQLMEYDFQFGENLGTLEILDGSVRMLPMSKDICPESICSDTGWIKDSYETIVCLPNRLIVTIESNNIQDMDIIVN